MSVWERNNKENYSIDYKGALSPYNPPLSSVIARSDWGGDLASPHPLQETLHIFPRPRRERVRVRVSFPCHREHGVFCHAWRSLFGFSSAKKNGIATPYENTRLAMTALARHPWMVLFPLFRHPWVYLSGVHKYLKPKKKQKRGFPIKDFGNDGGGGRHPWMPLSGVHGFKSIWIPTSSSPRQFLSRF